MPCERQQLPAGGRVPELERLVAAAADDPRAVVVEGRTIDQVGMAAELMNRLAGGGVINLKRVARAVADQPRAVVIERHAGATRALDFEQFLSARCIRHFAIAADDAGPGGVECEAPV